MSIEEGCMPEHLGDPARILPRGKRVGREDVPGVVEIPALETGLLQGGIPHPAAEIGDIDVTAARVGKAERASSGNEPLRLQGLSHCRQDIDVSIGGRDLEVGPLPFPPSFAHLDSLSREVNPVPRKGHLL
jgi:hypothetical protein